MWTTRRCRLNAPLMNLFFLALLVCAAQAAELLTVEDDHQLQARAAPDSTWWYAQIKHQGKPAYGNDTNYKVWRNVKEWGAKGDGLTDDTDAINNATFYQYRCGNYNGCDQQTTTPAIIYFPPGTYLVSRPLVMLYYTQFVGDASFPPTIKGTPDFFGIALLDSNPYLAFGYSWYQNQNNFWRHVRNFVLDMTAMPTSGTMSGIHWQVAQGTSMQNVVFNMVRGLNNKGENGQQGIFMDNGSGGWMEDLVFNGGGTCLFAGNQQWTSRNLTFNNCQTAIYQNWNWLFTYKSLTINNAVIGIDMTQGGNVITTSSLVIQDTVMNGITKTGILTTFSRNSTPIAAGTLILDNVNFVNTPVAISYPNETVILEGNRKVPMFVQGTTYSVSDTPEPHGNESCYQPASDYNRVQTLADPPPKPKSLLDANGKWFEHSKSQYVAFPLSKVRSIIDFGCPNDGITDATICVQLFFDSILPDQLAFIDHGAYVIRNLITIPNRIKIVGEAWSYFMVDGTSPVFSDKSNPQVAFRVGNPGDTGAVEITEIIFQTMGPAPGAIMMEWNLANENGRQDANLMLDVHWRIGGTNGTKLNPGVCTRTPNKQTNPLPECEGAFLLLHITNTGQVYMANNWGWVSDHQLDGDDKSNINLYNGRGVLVESQGPVWLYGTSFEHNVLYNYQMANAKEVYMGIIQTETAYMQGNPNSLVPFPLLESWVDPMFDTCFKTTCYKTWGLRIVNSEYIYLYGGGMYSFFDNYDSGCLITTLCQQNMVSIEQSQGIYLFAVNTVGTENMVVVDGYPIAREGRNTNGFTDTVAVFEYP